MHAFLCARACCYALALFCARARYYALALFCARACCHALAFFFYARACCYALAFSCARACCYPPAFLCARACFYALSSSVHVRAAVRSHSYVRVRAAMRLPPSMRAGALLDAFLQVSRCAHVAAPLSSTARVRALHLPYLPESEQRANQAVSQVHRPLHSSAGIRPATLPESFGRQPVTERKCLFAAHVHSVKTADTAGSRAAPFSGSHGLQVARDQTRRTKFITKNRIKINQCSQWKTSETDRSIVDSTVATSTPPTPLFTFCVTLYDDQIADLVVVYVANWIDLLTDSPTIDTFVISFTHTHDATAIFINPVLLFFSFLSAHLIDI